MSYRITTETSSHQCSDAAAAAAAEVINVRHGMFGVTGSGDTSGYGRLVREVALPAVAPTVRRLLR